MSYNQNPQKLDEVFSFKTAQAEKYYPHTDMLGSVYALSDSTGTSQASWTYDVYGTRTQTSGTLSYAFGFTGREHDGDTGLIYSRARYYDPSVGQWLSADRLGDINGPNLYQYALDNPSRFTDPSGNLIPLVAWLVVFLGLLLIENDENSGIGVSIILNQGIGMGVGAAVGGVCQAAGNAFNLSKSTLANILAKHGLGIAGAVTKSQFFPDVAANLGDLIENSAAEATSTPGQGTALVWSIDVGEPIGWDIANGLAPTSILTIITDPVGEVITAYPGLPY